MEESNLKFLQQEILNVTKHKEELKTKITLKEIDLEKLNIDIEDADYAMVKKEFTLLNEKKTKHISNFKKSNELLNSITSKDILLLKSTGETKETIGVLRLAGILFKENESW